MSEDRVYRAIPLLADEAAYIASEARNNITRCCGHLDVFHRRGGTATGGEWRSCQIDGCGCHGEWEPDHPIDDDEEDISSIPVRFALACIVGAVIVTIVLQRIFS